MRKLLFLYLVAHVTGCVSFSLQEEKNEINELGIMVNCDGGWLNTIGPTNNYDHCENFLD